MSVVYETQMWKNHCETREDDLMQILKPSIVASRTAHENVLCCAALNIWKTFFTDNVPFSEMHIIMSHTVYVYCSFAHQYIFL